MSFFRPRLIETLHGYDRGQFLADLSAGATVGVLALPLAMAFAIASGMSPSAGIWTAIVAGFLISALGGSRVQIGGPTGAFIPIVYGIVAAHGEANLLVATMLAGLLLFALGAARLGTLIRFIPLPVVIGFTNGIAVVIFLSQIKDFLGLSIDKVPAEFFGKMHALATALPTAHWPTLGFGLASLAFLLTWNHYARRQRWLARLPGPLAVLIVATAVNMLFSLPLETIGTRFGGIPQTIPTPSLPAFDITRLGQLLPPAIAIALLGAIESLLSARVADSMIDDRHDPNQELMAQGIANFVTPFFGGMPATGTIARTVTNVKSGATSPVAGMVHALALLLVMLVAAPLAGSIPLATLAAILMFVAWNMGEWREFARLKTYRLPYRVTLVSVFLLTVVFDLTVAVEFGIFAACLTFIYRISSLSRAEPIGSDDLPVLAGHDARVQVWRLHGALFFGATKLLEAMEDHLPAQALVLDLKNVIYVDSTGAEALENLAHACATHGVRLIVSGLMGQPLDILRRTGLYERLQPELQPDVASAAAAAVT